MRAQTRPGVLLPLFLALLTAGAYRGFSAIPNSAATADQIATRNISFRLTRDLLPAPPADRSFYTLLIGSSNIGRQVDVKPVDQNIVPNLVATNGQKPNIFVIVIDSLRRDYLTPYNPRVTFTPAIDRFARENIVMSNAFTHYGGTGLAEPSIWTGSMQLHKQYVTPFFPMNTLAKLINAEGYKSYVSMDNILDTVTPRTPNLTPLDDGRLTMDFDLCHSLTEAESKIEPGVPAFVYTQPQNIHISVIARENKSVPAGESYPGFYAPYASRLHRIDACFGQFIDFLKEKNLYDSSIVILTADHGDSLGEDGRFGHAYTIYPEIARIPLLVHLPSDLRSRYKFDASRIAFSTDITPSLYYLLGHENTIDDPLFGRPLFTHTLEEQNRYLRTSYPVVASYAAVYGVLTQEGKRLYIADAVNGKDYLYDVEANQPLTVNSSDQTRARAAIGEFIKKIDGHYGFSPAPE